MSDAKKENLIRERELAFFGEVTASVSHELNNAIAIIEQTSGLLEDLIAAGDPEASVPKKRLQTIVDRVGKQTKRGAMLVRRLNAFAHSVESAKREIELNDLSQCVIALAHRMAGARERSLLLAPPTDGSLSRLIPFGFRKHCTYLSRSQFRFFPREVESRSAPERTAPALGFV